MSGGNKKESWKTLGEIVAFGLMAGFFVSLVGAMTPPPVEAGSHAEKELRVETTNTYPSKQDHTCEGLEN